MWSRRLVLLALALVIGNTACTPKFYGPTASSGYFFSFRTSDRTIWLEPVNPRPDTSLPTFAHLTVQVQNAQRQPIDGVLVQFQIDPEWAKEATVVPQSTTTQAGQARAVFRADNTGVVRIQARVDDTTHQMAITVSPPYIVRENGQ